VWRAPGPDRLRRSRRTPWAYDLVFDTCAQAWGGGGAGTPAGTYHIRIAATGGAVTHTATYTLTVS